MPVLVSMSLSPLVSEYADGCVYVYDCDEKYACLSAHNNTGCHVRVYVDGVVDVHVGACVHACGCLYVDVYADVYVYACSVACVCVHVGVCGCTDVSVYVDVHGRGCCRC